jgi:hypothetical protein
VELFWLLELYEPNLKTYFEVSENLGKNWCVHPDIFSSHTKFWERNVFCGLCTKDSFFIILHRPQKYGESLCANVEHIDFYILKCL